VKKRTDYYYMHPLVLYLSTVGGVGVFIFSLYLSFSLLYYRTFDKDDYLIFSFDLIVTIGILIYRYFSYLIERNTIRSICLDQDKLITTLFWRGKRDINFNEIAIIANQKNNFIMSKMRLFTEGKVPGFDIVLTSGQRLHCAPNLQDVTGLHQELVDALYSANWKGIVET